ncbi:hypothetical protein [Mesoplasma corruscae]|uniref:Uncharacterized protein n=1 Tax=Mesoplasma corruscae TaxID=216874 RepID=A0A2S5RG41_9MOLU|nr:hypothetical protein [Mesoplasma corruscae]PPE06273.1 hypothetical protein MCORR_v1c05780 [Mesoplasma corruscae]
MSDKNIQMFKSFISFLKKEYKYKELKKIPAKENKVFLVNRIYKYQIIILDNDQSANDLTSENILYNDSSIDKDSILKITFSNNVPRPLQQINGIWSIQTNNEKVQSDLIQIFGDIHKLNLYQIEETKPENSNMSIQEQNEIKVKNFNSFMAKIKNNKISFTWAILVLFIILPSIATILGSVLNINWLDETTINAPNIVHRSWTSGAAQIVFGGTNRTITINGGQYWRILTYGFSAMENSKSGLLFDLLILFFVCSALFSTSRMTEIVNGSVKKIAIPFVVSYILLGFITSTTMPYSITSGPLPILSIMIGIMLMNVSGDKTPVSIFAKTKSVWPILIIILVASSSNDTMSSFSIAFLGMVFGSITYALTSKGANEWKISEKIMLFLLVLFIVVGIVFLFVLKTIPAYNNNILAAINFYLNKGIISDGYATNLVVNKIGWMGSVLSADIGWVWQPGIITGV